MVRLSIVIPSVATHQALEETLVSVLENRPADCEILVADAGSYADPYDLADEVQFVDTDARASVTEQINWAVQAARAPVVHLLLPGVTVSPDWTRDPVERLSRDLAVACVAPVRHDVGARQPCLGVTLGSGGGRRRLRKPQAIERLRGRGWGPTLAAGFYRRSALEAVHGWDRRLGFAADADLAVRLAEHRFQSASSPSQVTANVGIDGSQRWSTYQRVLDSERCFWRHAQSPAASMSLAAHGLAWCRRWFGQIAHPWTLPADWAAIVTGALTDAEFHACAADWESSRREQTQRDTGEPHEEILRYESAETRQAGDPPRQKRIQRSVI